MPTERTNYTKYNGLLMKFLKLTPFNLLFFVELLTTSLVALGLWPREAILFLSGLLLFYFIFAPLAEATVFFVASIPLFAALPLTEGFDTLANWRIFAAALFISYLINVRPSLKQIKWTRLGIYAVIFFAIGLLSLWGAVNPAVGLKKIIFLLNLLLLYPAASAVSREPGGFLKIIRAGLTASYLMLAIAFLQLVAVFRYPLFVFWQFWADKVIAAFYGQNLAGLLSYSNTWFSYFADKPPVLRLFSLMPDSHSFAMFLITALIFISFTLLQGDNWKRKRWWILAGLVQLGIILSGSRGAWLSIFPVLLIVFCVWRRFRNLLFQKIFKILLVFFLMFIMASFYPPLLYRFQDWQSGQISESEKGEIFAFLKRAKSISDISETSNLGRWEIWQKSFESLIKKPLLGVGFGNYPLVLKQEISSAKKGASAHNLYLDLAAELGFLGLIFLVLIFYEFLKRSWLGAKGARDPVLRSYAVAFGVFFIWILVYSFFDVVLLNDKVFLYFLTAAALLKTDSSANNDV